MSGEDTPDMPVEWRSRLSADDRARLGALLRALDPQGAVPGQGKYTRTDAVRLALRKTAEQVGSSGSVASSRHGMNDDATMEKPERPERHVARPELAGRDHGPGARPGPGQDQDRLPVDDGARRAGGVRAGPAGGRIHI